jgi:hypothetical protein
MATQDEKSELMAALRFTPRDIDITLLGYGGEIVMGHITAEQYNFWQGREDFSDYVWDWDYELPDGAPESLSFVAAGSWHDCDDIAHENSMELSASCWIRVQEVESGTEIWETRADIETLEAAGVGVECCSNIEREDFPGQYLFIGQSTEKGCFGSYRLRLREPFDPRKLRIHMDEIDGWRLVSGIEYDGEEPDNQGDYDTTGKGSDFALHYEPDISYYLTDWHGTDKNYPAHDGVYDIQVLDSVRRAWWVNSAWREQDGTEIPGVQRWRGLGKFLD